MREPLEELLDHATIGIAQIDTNGCYLRANDRYCEIIGRNRAEVVGAQLQDLVFPDDLPTALDGFIQVLEAREARVIDHRVVRRDGSVVWVGNTVAVASDGKAEHLLLLTQDVTRRKETERALARSRADLRMMIDSTAEGIYCMDRVGRLTLCNAAFLRMLGFARDEEVLGRDIHEIIHHSYPDGSPYPKINCPVYKTAHSGIHAHLRDEMLFRRDGTPLPIECWVRPIIRDGEIEGAVCTFFDATERKQAEAREQLLMREMAHRVKNTLAMVQAIVGQSLRGTPAARDVVRTISQRLMALGNAHNALTRTRWGNAAIAEIVESTIAVHRSHSSRIRASGPNIEIGSKAALGITMALHELCTNAMKYGALSNDAGTVAIDWAIVGGASDARFRMHWKEIGGPMVTPPAHRGFGSRLIAESVGPDLKGEARLAFEQDGVMWTLDAPLTAVKE